MTDEQKIADLLDGEWHDEKPHHAGLSWPLVERMQLMKLPPINRIRLLKAPAKADEQNKPVRSREEQIEDLASQIFFGARNHTDGMFEAKRHIQEAEARGAAEQRRKDAGGQEVVYQVYRGDYYGWFDCKKSEWEEDEREPEHKRILYAHPANVAALEGRIAELEGIADHACRCMSDGIEGLKAIGHGHIVQIQLRDEIEKIRAALKREGTPS